MILVIEDETNIRNDICMLLELEGFDAQGADNGKAGLQEIQASRPDLIFCDVVMPEMDGFELLMRLRHDPAYADIPFVFLSARISPEDIQRGMNAGANAYLKKPFTSDDLLDTINQLLASDAPDDPAGDV